MVIIIAVLLILSAAALPRLGRYWQVYQLDSATQTLSSNLEVARYSAVSRKRNVVVLFYASASWYETFEDTNANGVRDSGEFRLGSYALPRQVRFDGSGLLGPPASPTGSVSDPITFASDRIVFNPEGKISGGLGTIYLRNASGDASAMSYNMASRLKIYSWNRTSQTWK
jgi:Tfp pilus assembly protein FimT